MKMFLDGKELQTLSQIASITPHTASFLFLRSSVTPWHKYLNVIKRGDHHIVYDLLHHQNQIKDISTSLWILCKPCLTPRVARGLVCPTPRPKSQVRDNWFVWEPSQWQFITITIAIPSFEALHSLQTRANSNSNRERIIIASCHWDFTNTALFTATMWVGIPRRQKFTLIVVPLVPNFFN